MRIEASTWGLTLALLVASAVIMSAPGVHAQTPETADREARHWLHDFGSAFNRHDAAGAAAVFTLDADQRVSSGAWLSGRTEIERFLAALFETYPRARQELSLISARFSEPDLVLAEAAWEITGLPQTRSGFATYVLRREGTTWSCIAGRSMIPVR